MMAILKVKDSNGKVYDIPALRGPKGDKGDVADIHLFANAVKGHLNGEIVKADDVSPVAHSPAVKLKSRNLFNGSQDIIKTAAAEWTYENGTLTVKYYYINKYILLEEGKTYTFSCKSTKTGGNGGSVYLRAHTEDKSMVKHIFYDMQQLSPTVTFTVPKGYPLLRITFYGDNTLSENVATYSDLMLVEGEAAPYVPYVDTTNASVKVCGDNLLPYPYASESLTSAGVTFTVNANRSVTISGTPTKDVQFDLVFDMALPAGTYSFEGNGKNVRVRILKTDGTYKYTIDTFTLAEGEKVRLYAVALANEEINYTFFPMLNLGATVNPYEPYTGATYVASEDGTVEGVASISPTMTLFTTDENVVVNIEYNKDLNVVIDKIFKLLGEG